VPPFSLVSLRFSPYRPAPPLAFPPFQPRCRFFRHPACGRPVCRPFRLLFSLSSGSPLLARRPLGCQRMSLEVVLFTVGLWLFWPRFFLRFSAPPLLSRTKGWLVRPAGVASHSGLLRVDLLSCFFSFRVQRFPPISLPFSSFFLFVEIYSGAFSRRAVVLGCCVSHSSIGLSS